MKSKEELVARARRHADEVRLDMHYVPQKPGGISGYWTASQVGDKSKIKARATAALDFLRVYAGDESQWFRRAQLAYESHGDNESTESGVRQIGDILELWAISIEEGYSAIVGVDSLGVRTVASTDLMEQVRLLVADKSVMPAAPMMLAGAALEVALRGAVEEAGLEFTGPGSISTYAKVLRSAELLNKQDMKDIEATSGLRNAAAHGEHEDLSRERAGLMEQQVNMLLARLSTVLSEHPPP